MKKVVKRKRRVKFEKIITRTFMITGILYVLSSLGLRSYNSYLNVTNQKYQVEIATLSKENEVIQMEVNQLSTYDRIMSIAGQDGMSNDNDNIITVGNDE